MATIINNGSATRAQWAGKTSYNIADPKQFLVDYLGVHEQHAEPTLDEQASQFKAFHSKLKAMQGK